MTKSYRLGNYRFQIKSSDKALSTSIGSLFEEYSIDVDKDPLSLIDIDLPLNIVPGWDEVVAEASGLEIVRLIVRRALNYHHDFFWLDAATLVSPTGKLVLIAGPSHSGKSTAATALAFGHGWKLLAEDVSLVDPSNHRLIPFSSPLSLREGSLERIKKATGVLPAPVVGDEWIAMKNHLHANTIDFKLDLAIALDVTDGQHDDILSTTEVTPLKLMHSLLPLCNAIHLNNGIELLEQSLAKATCYKVSGGSLKERLQFIAGCTGEKLSI
ncbi:MAG TPA: hypothetical protein V6C76_14540 [Drouetiella sp.]